MKCYISRPDPFCFCFFICLGSISFEHHIPNKREKATMDIIIDKGWGLDVHKGTEVACIMGTGIKKDGKRGTSSP